jgi:hypothetical protein
MKVRKIKIITGCKTYGTTDLQLHNLCGDPECKSCSRFIKLFKEEVNKQISELKGNA